jgi:hypothetical protein
MRSRGPRLEEGREWAKAKEANQMEGIKELRVDLFVLSFKLYLYHFSL